MPDPNDAAQGAKSFVQDAPSISNEGETFLEAASKHTGGSLDISIESQSREGDKDPGCECPAFSRYHRKVMHLTHRTILQRFIKPSDVAVRLIIGIRWQGNGCDVIGAMPYLGSGSQAGFGASVTGTIQAVNSVIGRPQGMCDCCEHAACAEFSVALVIDPWIGPTVIKSGHIIVCANGEVGAEWQ